MSPLHMDLKVLQAHHAFADLTCCRGNPRPSGALQNGILPWQPATIRVPPQDVVAEVLGEQREAALVANRLSWSHR